jgi:6-phosphofructokinase 2
MNAKNAVAARIVTLTVNPALDTSATTEHVVEERKLRCGDARFDPGGGGLNVARAVKRLGGEVTALLASGGAVGRMLEDLIEREGIDHRTVAIEGSTRQNFTVFETANERQFRFGLVGPSISEVEWRRVLEQMEALARAADYVVASGSLPLGVPDDFYARLARVVGKNDARLILDASGEPLKQALAEGVFLVKPNLVEIAGALDREITDEEQQEEGVAELVKTGRAGAVVLSLGAGGVVYRDADSAGRVHAPSVPRRSAVGAGDSMVGGLVVALSRGAAFVDAVRFGVAAGSAAVMSSGTELCSRRDTEKLFERLRRSGS